MEKEEIKFRLARPPKPVWQAREIDLKLKLRSWNLHVNWMLIEHKGGLILEDALMRREEVRSQLERVPRSIYLDSVKK